MQTDTTDSTIPNIANIDIAIAIMKRAAEKDSISMLYWQTPVDIFADTVNTEKKLHSCGNKACFAGYIAISPEWKAAGGDVSSEGVPILYDKRGSYGFGAIAKWLGIKDSLASKLVQGDLIGVSYSLFYNKPWLEVTAEDVIAKLELIKSGELE